MKPNAVRIEKMIFQLFGFHGYRMIRNCVARKSDGFDELGLISSFLLHRKKRGLMVDVGAHRGESFQLYAYSGWQVIAFEPDPDPVKHQYIAARSTANVELLRSAVSNVAGQKLPFYVSSESTGVSSLSPFLDSHRAVDQFVETDTLANVLSSKASTKQLDFLKIDTEGHDFFVLQGLDWTNALQRPDVILCEFEDRKTVPLGYGYKDLGDYLLGKGYHVWLSEWYPIKTYGGQHQWRSIRRYPSSLETEDGWGNFIAVDSKYEEAMKKSVASFTR